MDTVERVLGLLKRHDVTAAQVLRETNLSHSSITQWKKGIAKPSYGALVKIAEYFNISLDYLQGLTDDPKPKHESEQSSAERLGNDIKQVFMDAGHIKPGEDLSAELREYAVNLVRSAVAMKTSWPKGQRQRQSERSSKEEIGKDDSHEPKT